MKKVILIIAIPLIFSCGQSSQEYSGEKYIVETTVRVKEGTTKEVLELFKSTNSDLVKGERDWIKASFSSNEIGNIVVVRAEWKTKESYITFSKSDKFKRTMRKFRKYFENKPEVCISKVLFEMKK